jgi:hypothetical protein
MSLLVCFETFWAAVRLSVWALLVFPAHAHLQGGGCFLQASGSGLVYGSTVRLRTDASSRQPGLAQLCFCVCVLLLLSGARCRGSPTTVLLLQLLVPRNAFSLLLIVGPARAECGCVPGPPGSTCSNRCFGLLRAAVSQSGGYATSARTPRGRRSVHAGVNCAETVWLR